MAQVSRDAALHGSFDVSMDLETPMKTISEEQLTPRRSERKRALFPSASPQTSDLGHMSPLGSSPERYSSAPASPDSTTFSPIRKTSGPISPFGRKPSTSRALYKDSPRKQFALLLADVVNQPKNKSGIVKISKSKQNGIKPVEDPNEIVPADQLEQTVLSVMDESDCAESPLAHRTPSATPKSNELVRAVSDLAASQPLTPSKRRSMPASGSGSVTSASPSSPEKRRHTIEGRSRSAGAELPRARTSLFPGVSRSVGSKRVRDDGIYLTGRSTKRRKMNGEINAGVRTGIRRPPKTKPKVNQPSKKQGKVKSIWDVAPKSNRKKSISPIKVPKMSMLAIPVKKSDEELAEVSASAFLRVRSKRAKPEEDTASESEQEAMDSPPPDPTKRIFKTGNIKSRTATITISKNIRIKIHKGKFTVDKSSPAPPPKRRRKLYSHDKQIESIKAFDDNEEDVAASTRNDVQNILEKLEEDKCNSPESVAPVVSSMNSTEETSHPNGSYTDAMPTSPGKSSTDVVLSSPVKSSTNVVPSSPERSSERPSEDSLLSPLSQLASSTSTLSINVGGDTLHLTESQVQTLSAVPDVIMEDDDLPLCEPLPEDDGNPESNETKENENSSELDSTPVKYFPIFDSNFSHQKAQLSPNVMQKRRRSLLRPIGNDQYQLDAGQKRFGATECSTCSAIYQMGEPEDELAHQEFHNAVKDLKFMGWKNERIVGLDGRNRVVVVRPGDPKAWWSKALDVLRVVDKDLGFAEGVQCDPNHSMVFLYISEKSVVGCLLAVPVKNANKMLETSLEAEGIDCCTAEEYPVKCGVSRIWVHRPNRRANVARQLMDCMRKNFIFGHVLTLEEIAFSSPTVLGKVFAEHYTGRKDYFVYTNA
ncbi:N-acetyltransferase ESCO2 [Thrips palmi]|uniref:N-acetyltransferase ESCO2 n=1 Tax=Thrips palmi TaxID=161013 RepID=A0A6P8Z8V2_THRPL|nr:N-acetyltransferase ESCO2 [Thrips palmi]XP_034243432.1 N-acetyltransferase ESCO2 [Thrips palmi]